MTNDVSGARGGESPPKGARLSLINTLTELFWCFFTAAFLGALIETLFMLVTSGRLYNRSGVLHGQLSLVWGLGAALFTVLLGRVRGKSAIFLWGAAVGTGFEFLCSWLLEVWYGLSFWDYSHLPLALGRRIHPLFSVFWGLTALLWMTVLLPRLRAWLSGRAPRKGFRTLTGALALLIVLDTALTGAALGRMDARERGVHAESGVAHFLDERYPDERLVRYYTGVERMK